MCRVVAWIVPRLILMILILMAICCAMILLALPPLWILMILVAICCAVFLLALPLRILMTHDASGYWNAGKWWSGYFHLLLKKESRNRVSIILVRPRGFPRETRLMFIIIAVIGLFWVDTPEKKALLSMVSFCRLKPTQNLAGILYSVLSPSFLPNSKELIDIELLLLKIDPPARLSSFMIPALFIKLDRDFWG